MSGTEGTLNEKNMANEHSPSPVDQIREQMRLEKLDAYTVHCCDAHQSEYPCDRDRRIAFLSGFTGSFSQVIVTSTAAFLWTDGRYFLQASLELSSQWTLMRLGDTGVPTLAEWLELPHKDLLPEGAKFGLDPSFVSLGDGERYRTNLNKSGRELKCIKRNLVDAIWSNPPPRPCGPIRVHPFKYAGKSSTDKLSDLKSSLRSKKATAQLVCSLDEVAWLLNIRGSDLTCTPVAFAYVLVVAEDDGGDGSGGGASGCTLFIDEQKLNDEVKQHLPSGLRIRPYSEALDVFEDLVKVLDGVLLDKSQLSLAVGDAVPENKRVYAPSPITLKKAIKNESEINGIRNCHIRDGAALTAFLAWLEEAVNQSVSEKGGEPLTEYTICEKLESYRSAQSGYVEPSFPAITGFGPNGAIMHYRATPESALTLDTSSMFLLDSGGQYEDGTTDITRTVHWGMPTDHEIRCFTLVLKGHISLAIGIFPDKTPGTNIDILARAPLWKEGLDYNHGTGHGVGAALGVHEGPQSISCRSRHNVEPTGLQVGMVTSNEPGYYEDGCFGIRIENVCDIVEADTPHRFGGKAYLRLRTISLAPIQRSLIDVSLLTDDELQWLNDYHAEVRGKLGHLLENEPRAYKYLIENTWPIRRP